MASNYIPYLPSSPPPFDTAGRDDDDDDDDDEGEFGTFTCAMYANDIDPTDGEIGIAQKRKNRGASSRVETDCCDATEGCSSDCKTETSPVSTNKTDSISDSGSSFEQKESALLSGPSKISTVSVDNSDGRNDNVHLDEVCRPSQSTMCSSADSVRYSASPAFIPLQPDSTSQDSVTDSGMCSGSAHSESSPLPKSEGIFADFPQDDCVNDGNDGKPLPHVTVAATDFGFSAGDDDAEDSWADFSSATSVNGVESDSTTLTVDCTDALNKHSSAIEASDSVEQCFPNSSVSPVTRRCVQSDAEEGPAKEMCIPSDGESEEKFFHSPPKTQENEFSEEFSGAVANDDSFSCEPSLTNAISQESLVLPAIPTSDDAKFDSDEYEDFVCISTTAQPLPDTTLAFKPLSCEESTSSRNTVPSFSDVDLPPSHNEISSDDHNIDDLAHAAEPLFEASFDEEFGTFSSASLDSADQASPTSEEVLRTTFPSPAPEKDVHVELLETLLCDAGSVAESRSSVYLWTNLGDIEKTNALTYQWNSSTSSKKLLKALNIDSRNLLFGHNWNSSVPIFATNLSFNPLEPTKTPLKAEEKVEDKEKPQAGQTQEVIPPAQFDWRSSGLVNPLDASNNASALLDLDYFFTNDSTPVTPVPSATWSLENELLGPELESKVPSASTTGSKVSPLLEQILSSAKFSAGTLAKPKASPNLSEEAQRILNKLPNLSFMQAKVLMFPIRSPSP